MCLSCFYSTKNTKIIYLEENSDYYKTILTSNINDSIRDLVYFSSVIDGGNFQADRDSLINLKKIMDSLPTPFSPTTIIEISALPGDTINIFAVDNGGNIIGKASFGSIRLEGTIKFNAREICGKFPELNLLYIIKNDSLISRGLITDQ